jgi:6-phosphofructokinase 1
MKRIAVLTSGGDAPGMNAAIRAVTRTALAAHVEVFGIRQGYAGLLAGDFVPLGARDVGGIIQHGGTVLGSARCIEFRTDEGVRQACRVLDARKVEGLVVIGGNGSQTGAHALHNAGFPVLGVASTIDNDLYGSEVTIGVDTALNIALEAIDRLKVTASSHHRAFLVEVMGRDCGYLAVMAALAGGTETVIIPEAEIDPEQVAQDMRSAYLRGKAHAMAVVAEGAHYNAEKLAQYFSEHRDRLEMDIRVTKLGHVQRGGAPGAFDRILATRLGNGAAERLLSGEKGHLVGLIQGKVATTPLEEVVTKKKEIDLNLFRMVRMLAQ